MDENQITNKTEDTTLNAASDDNTKQTGSPFEATESHIAEASDAKETTSTTTASPINSAFEVKNSAASAPVTYYSAPERTDSIDSTADANTKNTTDTSNTYTETARPAVNSDFYTNSYSNTTTETPKGFAIASLVMGILGILSSCCCGLGTIFCILGIIFGCVQQKDENDKKPGMAIAGLITSGIGLLLGVLITALFYLLGDSSIQ
ncbi:MAG: DUF4190 domain-containing protein [Lachnospiraceae bacterium]|nr:DUF4190 domain-containing protein [Lachnospiraceae bacterium]